MDSIPVSNHPVRSSHMSRMYWYPLDSIPISTKSRLNFRSIVGTHVGLIMTLGCKAISASMFGQK